jgi:hypothetical protein
MGPKGSGNKWKWEVSMDQLILQSRPFLKWCVPCRLREISWFQGSLKDCKIQRRINGRIIYRNRGCSWDLSKFPVVTSKGIVLRIFCSNSIWKASFQARSNSYLFLPHCLITKLVLHANLNGFCHVAHENYTGFAEIRYETYKYAVHWINFWVKVKVKQSRYRPGVAQRGSWKLRFPGYMTTAQDGGKVVSLTHRPPLTPENVPGNHFC